MRIGNLRVLTRKEIKKLKEAILNSYGYEFNDDYVFLISEKNRVYILSPEVKNLNIDGLRIMHTGMYFCEWRDDGIRLSIDGSQLIGKKLSKQVLELTDSDILSWLAGNDINLENYDLSAVENSYVVIKHKNDFYGSGKLSGMKLYNYVPKARRVNAIT